MWQHSCGNNSNPEKHLRDRIFFTLCSLFANSRIAAQIRFLIAAESWEFPELVVNVYAGTAYHNST